MKHYILQDDKPVLEQDVTKWAKWFKTANRQVAVTTVNGLSVSTVFLGLDHSWNGGDPVLWETMVFGSDDEIMQRYTSKEDAVKGHEEIVEMVKRKQMY